MQVIRDPSGDCLDQPHAVTIGVFDGVHRGHQHVVAQTRSVADRAGARLAVVTFDPHPARVVRPENAPRILTGIDHRLELLEANGVDTTVVINFDGAQAAERAEEFVARVLVGCLMAQSVSVGTDFHFGHNREGTTSLLTTLGADHGFEVLSIQPVKQSDDASEPISSTAIRRALAGGEVQKAAAMLGRDHQVRGIVRTGDQRGRTIGFPTANVEVPPERALPADGVYAAWYVTPDGSRHGAAVNVGKRPTFYTDAERSLVEAHLLDFDGDLYDQEGRVEFAELIRSERRFEGIDALKTQLAVDIQTARDILAPGVSQQKPNGQQ